VSGGERSAETDYIRGLRDAARMVDDAWEQGLGLNAAARAIRRHAEGCAELAVPAPGTPKKPVDGTTDPCPTPGYGGAHVAVGAGAITSPYVCHGCSTWFVLPVTEPSSPPGQADRA
jgi:hypothetical protein